MTSEFADDCLSNSIKATVAGTWSYSGLASPTVPAKTESIFSSDKAGIYIID